MKLILAEPFKTLWAGRDAFAEVEKLEGQVFRELAARRTLRTVVEGQPYFVKIHRGIGWAKSSRTWSPPNYRCWARARSGWRSSACRRLAYRP